MVRASVPRATWFRTTSAAALAALVIPGLLRRSGLVAPVEAGLALPEVLGLAVCLAKPRVGKPGTGLRPGRRHGVARQLRDEDRERTAGHEGQGGAQDSLQWH